MADFAVGDKVVVYTQEAGLRSGILVALASPDSSIPMHTVRIGEILWAGPELHLFAADTTEEVAQEEVDQRLATYGQELAARHAEREAQLEAALAAAAGEDEEGEDGEATEDAE